MEKKNSENKEDKSSLKKTSVLKLLPAAAVVTAIAVAGAQGQTVESEKTVKASEGSLRDAEELEGLITTAYSYDFSDGSGDTDNTGSASSQAKTNSQATKKKTGGIKTGSTKTLPEKTAASTGTGQGSTTTPTTSVPAGGYKDGTYQGSGTGFGGTITVQVTVSGGKITAIDVLSASGETASYFANAKGVISKILSSQSPNVDAVSGATYSSNGIISAVQNALAKAANGKITPTPTPKAKKKTKKTTNTKKTSYKDGTYTASAEGFNGDVTVTAVIKGGKITELSSKYVDTPEFFNKAWKQIKSDILTAQSADVDTVSGATYSSNGIINAVKQILKEAASTADTTPTTAPTATPVPTTSPSEEDTSLYKDGSYSGSAEGYSGTVTVIAVIKDGKITELTNTNADTPSFFSRAWRNIRDAVYEKQSADGIDTVSGATYSSNGILNAVKAALAQASATATPTPTAAPTATPEATPAPEVTPTAAPKQTVTPTPEATPTVSPELTTTPAPEATPTTVPEATATPAPTEVPASGYKDGTYTGTGTGFNGAVSVTVTISGGKITGATYSGEDDEPEFSSAWNGIYNQILGNQSADGIDTVSEATYSSEGLIEAFQNALSQAK